MPIITCASTKGGPGKTTLSLCLADHWRRAGRSVELLDVDPNRNLSQWVKNSGSPLSCSPIDEDDIVEKAAEAETRSEFVVIDVAGALARGLVHAIAVANVVLIPSRPDAKDTLEAARTYQNVIAERRLAQRRNPKATIPAAVVLMQVNKRAQSFGFAKSQLEALNVPMLGAEIPFRAAYQNYSFAGLPLDDSAVRSDYAELAAAVESVLHG